NTKSTYQTNIPVYNLVIGGSCNSSSYIRRTNNSNAVKVVESSEVECLAEKERCTYWFSFDSESGWVTYGKGTDTRSAKALLKWQDPSPLLNLKYIGLSNYNNKINFYNIRTLAVVNLPSSSAMIANLCFNVLNGHDYWLSLTLNTTDRINRLIFDAIAPGGDIRVTFSPINTKSTYQTNIPVYNLVIGGSCNSSSYIRRTNNSNAVKVVESSEVECLAEKERCTYWFSFDSESGWVTYGKGTDTRFAKALLKWQDPSPLLNLRYIGLSNYNYKINFYNIRTLAITNLAPPLASTASAGDKRDLVCKTSIYAHRVSDMIEEPNRMMLPIEGYAQQPLVSLEKAIAPLIFIVPDIERKTWLAIENSKTPADGLTSGESASIILYSMEWSKKEESLYYILNSTLRKEKRDLLQPWFLYLKLMLTGLGKLPSIIGRTFFRGVKGDFSKNYQQGNKIVWWGFSSCTSTINVLEQEEILGKTGVRTLFAIESKSAKDIRHHSIYPDENEILFLPATQFEVIGQYQPSKNVFIIQLQETEPLYPLRHPV
ncbi:unnamed protein product, partial [Rotaria sp. Silwood1]